MKSPLLIYILNLNLFPSILWISFLNLFFHYIKLYIKYSPSIYLILHSVPNASTFICQYPSNNKIMISQLFGLSIWIFFKSSLSYIDIIIKINSLFSLRSFHKAWDIPKDEVGKRNTNKSWSAKEQSQWHWQFYHKSYCKTTQKVNLVIPKHILSYSFLSHTELNICYNIILQVMFFNLIILVEAFNDALIN